MTGMARLTQAVPTSILIAALAATIGCGGTPTEVTALPRAVGEVDGVLLRAEGLAPLTGLEGRYHAWALLERSRTESLGPFLVDEVGTIVDADGNPIESFTSDAFNIRETLGILITIESPTRGGDSPGGFQLLSGVFIDGVAELTVPIDSAIREATGSLRVFTPTDGPDSNENAGVWAVNADGSPALDLPDTTGALLYETFVDIDGQSLTLGRFDLADRADTICRFCGDLDPPAGPGDDLLFNPPAGLLFPADLSGARVTISLESRVDDVATRSQLVILEAVLPLGLRGGEQVAMINRAGNFPTATAVLY